jgi:hypothetical protein
MCSRPKMPSIPEPVPPPAPPPPPTKVAQKVENKTLKNRQSSKKRGTSALTVRRSTVNTGSSGSGANINY